MSTEPKNMSYPYRKNKLMRLFSLAFQLVISAVKQKITSPFASKIVSNTNIDINSNTWHKLLQQHADAINTLEQQRQQLLRSTKPIRQWLLPIIGSLSVLLATLLLVLAGYVFLNTGDVDALATYSLMGISALFWGLMLSCIIIMATYGNGYLSYHHNYRHIFIPALAQSFADINYQQYGYIELSKLKNNIILPTYDVIYQEDYFCGTHKGCQFELAEAELYRHQRGKQSNNLRFSGLILSLTLPVAFNSTTLVRKNSVLLNAQRHTPMTFKAVYLEDSYFNKLFKVYSDDQVAARSWLTPAVMERLQQLKSVFHCLDFQTSLHRNHLLLLLQTNQDFLPPPPLDIPATHSAASAQFIAELQAMYQLIDTLLAQFPNYNAIQQS